MERNEKGRSGSATRILAAAAANGRRRASGWIEVVPMGCARCRAARVWAAGGIRSWAFSK